jgi:hypothetical protein
MEVVLDAARGSLRSDHGAAGRLVRTAIIVNRVDGLASGLYGTELSALTPLKAGDYAADAAHLALDQEAAAGAAVNLYFVASLAEVTATLGGRGYRAVQMEAGIRTGQVYLAATALGLRATGLTFYDDTVARFFDLDPEDTAVLMLVAFGG